MPGIETTLLQAAWWVKLPIEMIGALLIIVGVFVSFVRLLRFHVIPDPQSFHQIRLFFARYLVLGLEFQLAADILGTTISPSWEQIGKLAAIALIRTFLNFFLVREMKEEEQEFEKARVQTGVTADSS